MLRIIQNRSAASAQWYYSQADYYSEGQELIGLWGGEAAKRLGLEGVVGREAFQALSENRHPLSGDPLTLRTKADRTVGYDFNFHAPKSVSVMYSLTGDERILAAFRSSVSEAMQLVERDAKTRVRKNGAMSERPTQNLAWAEYIHFTARPVDGEPDPHLHAHCFTFNVTWDTREKSWKAVQFREIKRDGPFYEAAFHAAFAHRLRELGYGISRSAKSWEIAGIDPKLVRTFSRRTALIEELARDKGILNAADKDALGAKTREGKSNKLTMEELKAAWENRLTTDQRQAVKQVADQAKMGLIAEPRVASSEALSHAIAHQFERNSVVPTRKILETAMRYGVGDLRLDDVERAVPSSDLIVRDWEGHSCATSHEVLAEEKRMLDFARNGKATRAPLNPAWTIQRTWLNAGQQAAVRHLLNSPDRVLILKGRAGTGKTRLMQEAVEGIEAGGHRVLTLAPSAEASRGVLRAEGFQTADTVARFLLDRTFQEQVRDQVLWIDEAGLMGTKSMTAVFDLAQRLNVRLILAGDWRQHGPVERGCALRLLETDAGLKPAEVRTVKRQSGEYKEAVSLLAMGHTRAGFEKLDGMGWMEELKSGPREARVAKEYLASLERNEEVLVVCPTHAEGEQCTTAIRDLLKAEGRLGTDEHTFLKLEPKHLTAAERADPAHYEPGDVLVLTQNVSGYKKGTRFNYSPELDAELAKLAPRSQVYRKGQFTLATGDKIRMTTGGTSLDGHRLNNGTVYRVKGFTKAGQPVLDNGWNLSAEWGHWDRAFVSTSHASQGRSVPRVIVCQSALSQGAASLQQFYVSVSRGEQSCLILCDSKENLWKQISRSETRVSATEFTRQSIRPRNSSRLGFVQRLIRHVQTVKNYLIHHFPQQERSFGHAR